jgi:hypothetical protein
MINFSPINAAEIYSMIRRREFIAGLGAAAWPLAAWGLIDVSPTTAPASISANRAEKAALRVALDAYLSMRAR